MSPALPVTAGGWGLELPNNVGSLSAALIAAIGCPGLFATSKNVAGKYPSRPSLARQRHHSLGLPRGSHLLRTAMKSPFLTARSTPWVALPVSGVKSYSTRQNSSLLGSRDAFWPATPRRLRSSSCVDAAAMERIALLMIYGRPNAARMKKRRGFLLGFDGLEGPLAPVGAWCP